MCWGMGGSECGSEVRERGASGDAELGTRSHPCVFHVSW